jgi:hypothetical protein
LPIVAEAPQPTLSDAAAGAQLAPGWYWISLDDHPPEVALRDAEAREWLLIGSETGISVDHPADVAVLSGPISPPP